MWKLKKWKKWIYLQNRNVFLTDTENKYMATKGDSDREGEGRGEIKLELGLTDTHRYI